MAKFCGKCGAPINENMKFCTKCGYKFENNNIKQSEPMQKVQPAVSVQPANKLEPPIESKKKTGKTVLIIILIIAILAGIGTAGFIAYDKFWKNKSTEEDFKEALRKCSDRNMIAFYYDDYDSDGNNEAYAIMGNDGDTEKNYSNADIWFVNSDTPKQVDENVSGHTNGKISQGKTKFVSFERNTNDDNSVSDLYGVKENKSYEPEISGQYKNVHQDGQAIVAEVIETGNEIELKINDSGDIEVCGEIENSGKTTVNTENLVANDDDFDELVTIINSFSNFTDFGENGSYFLYSCDDASAYENILPHLLSNIGGVNELYNYYFLDDTPEFICTTTAKPFKDSPEAQKDPLNKFSDEWSYCKISADNVDWIIENVFCIPVSRSENEVGESRAYYYEDYYYFVRYDGGDSIPTALISNQQKNSDNSYTVTMDYIYDSDSVSNHGDYESKEIQCKLQMIDGKRQWRITSIAESKTDGLFSSKKILNVNISTSPTASELKNALIGCWNPIGQSDESKTLYAFTKKGNLSTYVNYILGDGTYTISDDLTLKLDFLYNYNGDSKTLKWNTNAKADKTGWYIDADGYLIMEGISYGKIYDENCYF